MRTHFFAAIMAVSALNGMFSPHFQAIAYVVFIYWLPPWFVGTREIVTYIVSLVGATMTLFLSGVPAALYERLWERRSDSVIPMIIWLVTAFALSLPAIGGAVRFFGASS